MEQIKKKKSKAVTFTLNDETLSMLAELAETNSNSQSYEVRRLIKDEYNKQYVTKYRKLFEGDETRIYFYAKEMTRKIKTLEEIDKEKAMKLKREFISRMHEFEDETN